MPPNRLRPSEAAARDFKLARLYSDKACLIESCVDNVSLKFLKG
jgi:hypothetical protein